jgi:hypothetical protein
MKKPVTKREFKTFTFSLSSDDCWDTLKAQLLSKLDAAFDPKVQKLEDFNVMFHIPRNLTKPGLHLTCDKEFQTMLKRVSTIKNNPVINITLSENPCKAAADDEKENKTKKSSDQLAGNLAKNNNISQIQEHWKCPKKQADCLGTHCYVDENGSHLPLGHERLKNWATSMVRAPLL